MKKVIKIIVSAVLMLALVASLAATVYADEEEVYEDAVSKMYAGDCKEAEEMFEQLGDYKDSAANAAYLEERETNPGDLCNVNERLARDTVSEGGTLKECISWVYYVPNTVDKNTKCILYYPGGCGEAGLFTQAVRDYVAQYNPNAIIVAMRTSGYGDAKTLSAHVEKSYQLLETICRENGIVIHDLVLAGSSNGGYTGLKAISDLFLKHHIAAKALLVYDMGVSFTCAHLLPNADECKIINDIGTKMYFFEQTSLKRNDTQLEFLMNMGFPDDYVMVYCTHDEHNRITWDGFSTGTLSWALGEQDSIPSDHYTFG